MHDLAHHQDWIEHDPTPALPPGMTCADCEHCRRCCGMFGKKPTDTECDFSPSRFFRTYKRTGVQS